MGKGCFGKKTIFYHIRSKVSGARGCESVAGFFKFFCEKKTLFSPFGKKQSYVCGNLFVFVHLSNQVSRSIFSLTSKELEHNTLDINDTVLVFFHGMTRGSEGWTTSI